MRTGSVRRRDWSVTQAFLLSLRVAHLSSRDRRVRTSARDGGVAVVPLAGARVRPDPRAAPSSGTSVVPFGARACALRGAPGGVRGVGPFFPARRRWSTGKLASREFYPARLRPAAAAAWSQESLVALLGLDFALFF